MLDSGSKDTSRRNTILKGLYTNVFALRSGQRVKRVIANGDDGLFWGVSDVDSYVGAAADLGVTIRGAKSSGSEFEFCSHNYSMLGTGCEVPLTSWRKAAYRMLCKELTFSDAMQVVYEVRHNKQGKQFLEFVKQTFGGDDN
jgi:hypothetical protein